MIKIQNDKKVVSIMHFTSYINIIYKFYNHVFYIHYLSSHLVLESAFQDDLILSNSVELFVLIQEADNHYGILSNDVFMNFCDSIAVKPSI